MTAPTRRVRMAGLAIVAVAVLASGWLASSAAEAATGGWTISPGPESITVSWSGFTKGESLNVTLSGGGAKSSCSSTAGSCTVTGLTDGTSYAVSAIVSDATGTVSSTGGAATPFTTPDAVVVSASAGDGAITVQWTPPSFDGGSRVVGYTARATSGSVVQTCSGSGSGCTITGLVNGTRYVVNAAAINAAGPGPWSAGVAVVPARVPGVVGGVAAGRDGTDHVTLSWQAPGDDGGSPVTGYVIGYSKDAGSTWTRVAGVSGAAVPGIDETATYVFEVAAINALGPGPWSSQVPGTPMVVSGMHSHVTVAKSRVEVGGTDQVIVKLRDASGLAVAGRLVTLTTGAGTVLTATSDASGVATFSVGATKAGVVSYRARDVSSNVVVGTLSVGWRAGRAKSVHLFIQDAGGGARMIVVSVHDRYDNAVSNAPVALTGPGVVETGRSDGQGVVHFLVRGTGTVDYKVSTGGRDVQAAVTFSRSSADTTTSTTSTSGTTSTTGTTTTTVTTSTSGTTSTTGGGGRPSGRGAIRISFEGGVGLKTDHYTVEVTGRGLGRWSGATAVISVHSREIVLGRAVVAVNGTFRSLVHLPKALDPGLHHLIVRVGSAGEIGTEAFYVTGGVVSAIGGSFGPLDQYTPMTPDRHSHELLGVMAGLIVALAAVGARGRKRDQGSEGLVDLELERVRGDETAPDETHGTRGWLEEWSRHSPARLSRVSPVLGRVASDGDYLRASLGPGWLVGCLAAVGLGVLAARGSGWYATVPSSSWLIAITMVGVMDAAWGLLAGVAWAGALVLAGHVNSTNEIRGVMGVVLLWFAVSLASGSIAPLRRRVGVGLEGAWVRASDVVVASAFGGFVALEMSRALAPLFGVELGTAVRPAAIALTAVAAVAVRMGVETIVAHRRRTILALVEHDGELVAGTGQMACSLVVQMATFWFISVSVVGGWTLVAGTVVFFAPLMAGLREWRATTWARRIMATGIVKWSAIIVTGAGLAWIIEHSGLSGRAMLNVGFVVLALPVVSTWTLELFEGGEGERAPVEGHDARWGRRVLAAAMAAGVVWLVVTGRAGG